MSVTAGDSPPMGEVGGLSVVRQWSAVRQWKVCSAAGNVPPTTSSAYALAASVIT